MKRIAFVSHEQVFPVNSGNRARMLDSILYFQQRGYQVEFFLVNGQWLGEPFIDDKNFDFFTKDFFHLITPKKTMMNRLRFLKLGLKRKLRKSAGFLGFEWGLFTSLDQNEFNLTDCEALHNQYDIIFVNYVFNSWTIQYFTNKGILCLDAHDQFSNRHRSYMGKFPKKYFDFWLSLTDEDEACGLARFNMIFAIQQTEANVFEKLLEEFSYHKILKHATKVNVVSKFPMISQDATLKHYNSIDVLKPKVFFIGSRNPSNLDAAKILQNTLVPAIAKRLPEFSLDVYGAVSDFFSNDILVSGKVCAKGHVKELGEVMYLGDVLLNPMSSGTGLAIKVMDALAYGCCIISTKIGMRGVPVEIYNNNIIIDLDDPDSFLNLVIPVITDPVRCREIGRLNQQLYLSWMHETDLQLKEFF